MYKKLLIFFLSLALAVVIFTLLTYQKRIFVFSQGNDLSNGGEITFLVLGKMGKVVGYNDAPELTDSVFIFDYHPQIGAANVISLPRDLYVKLGEEQFKLNEALERGKIKELTKKLPEITGLTVNKYVIVDMEIFKKIVDELGGIDLELKSPLVDWVSGYKMEAGKQHLNGERALWVARNRFAPEGDFMREKNQQEIIRAIFKKYKELNFMQKTALIIKITPELSRLESNINFQEILPLFDTLKIGRFNRITLDFSTGLLQSAFLDLNSTTASSSIINSSSSVSSTAAYILIPRKGANDYSEIKTFIDSRIEK